MTNFMMTCCVVLGTLSAAAATSSSGLRSRQEGHEGQAKKGDSQENVRHHSMLVQAPEVQHSLMICNAYASPNKIEIVQVSTRQVLTESDPLAYKQCKDFTLSLHEGEQLDFKAGGLDVGTFFATGLPTTAASLLLIPHRRSPHSVGCTFDSHAFAEVQSPQIAVIDAYRGKSEKQTGAVKIIERVAASGDKAPASLVEEELKFNSVVAVNPGKYEIALTGTDGSMTGTAALIADGSTKFVVMRLGVEDESQSGRYPQELVVFPNGTMRSSVSLLTFIAACLGLRDLF